MDSEKKDILEKIDTDAVIQRLSNERILDLGEGLLGKLFLTKTRKKLTVCWMLLKKQKLSRVR